MRGARTAQDGRYPSSWLQVPPAGRTRSTGRRWLAQGILAGVILAGYLLLLPWVGAVVGSIFGIDMAVLP